MDYDDDHDDDAELIDCPNCAREYDEIDRDYYICSKCGYDANNKTLDRKRITLNTSRYGIDPDAQLDDWG